MDGLTPKDEQKIIKSITWTVSLEDMLDYKSISGRPHQVKQKIIKSITWTVSLEDLLDYKSISGQRLNKKLFSA